ncbi:MAG: imidazole glycerol phosphate synthase subunit HisH [Gammaproteobacteria bacterium]|nr:imidazole glycerol phosphate synthase subunit HisH [Gammaproteobacteria bacterium]MDH5630648.1 imidazole glycerol phosphate synthase subunit HisH [Gammaproteobacteria bacterium]
MNKYIVIIDTGDGNLFSLKAAVAGLGYIPVVLSSPEETSAEILDDAAGVIIYARSRYSKTIKLIKQNRWDSYLEFCKQHGKAILAIGIGLHIFYQSSEEAPGISGLGWLNGKVLAGNFSKIPLSGWTQINSQFWNDVAVYFTHLYALPKSDYSIATTRYGDRFSAAIQKDSFTGLQFFPDKSGAIGMEIIEQALGINTEETVDA